MNKKISTYVAFVFKRRNLFWCAGVLTILCSTASAQIDTLHLSLPDAFGKRGVTYAYPVYSLDSLTTLDSIYSGEFTIQQNTPAVVDVVSIDTIGTILSGVSSVYYNSVNNKIVFAHTQPITGNGVLFYLLVQFKANASGTKTFTLINNLLNEGQPWDPIVVVDPGSLRPMDIFINPKNPPQDRVVGDTLIFSVTGDVTLPITWMVSDTSVASIDSLGMLIGKNVGQTTVSVTDALGLTDQSAVLPIHPPSLRSLTVTVPDTSIMQNLVFDLPIRVSDVTSLGIVSAQFSLSYNQTILKPIDVITAGTLTQPWSQPVVNYGSGTMQVALAGADTLTGSGTLVYVRFKVARFASFGASINLSNVLFNENLNASIDNGFFSPLPGPVITIPNFPFGIMRNETAQLTASGGTAPYKWLVASDTSVANIDSVNGTLTTKKSGFLKVTVIDMNGFDKSDSTYVADARITFPDTSFIYSDTIDVPVSVSDLNGLSVLSGQMKFNYDSTKIRLQQVVQTGTMIAPMLLEWRDSLGNVRIAFSGSTSLSGSGVLMKLRFIATSPLSIGFNQILMANELFFNEPGPQYRIVTQKAGKISVLTKPNTPPVFTNKLRDTTIAENQFFTFQLQATDADGDSIIFGIFNAPPGMSFNPKTGLITWTPSFTQAGTYKLNYDVGDFYPDGVVKDSATITVTNKNQSPLIVNPLPNTDVGVGNLFSHQFTATDPENDPLQWSIIGIPLGASFTANGLLQWRPNFMQSGMGFTVTVSVSDGANTVNNQFLLSAVFNNHPPVFTSFFTDTTISTDQELKFAFVTTDVDQDTMIYSLENSLPGMSINPSTGLFSWTPGANQAGVHAVTVVADDRRGMFARADLSITVVSSNLPPVFVSVLPNTTIAEGQTLTFNYQASDPDNDTLVWTFQSTPPSGMTITAGGSLSWTPSFTQAGSYQIVVRVSDKSFALLDTALITVTNTNLPPNFTAVLPDTTIYADSLFSFSYKGGDPDGDSISFALTKSPAGAIITAKGNLSWVPTLVRKDTFVVSISDGSLTAVDTAIVSVTGFPKLQTAIFELDFGTTIFGTLPKKEITIKNIGVVPLVLNRMLGLPGENNYSVNTTQQVTLNVQEEKVLTFTYAPENIGTHIGGIAFQTNDPKQPVLGVLLKGTAISKSTLKKKILVDNAHISTIPLRDSLDGMTQLFSALKSSGFAVSFAETTLAPAGFDAVLIVAPQKDFSQQEKSLLRQYVSEGGLIVMMGNEGVDSTSNFALNKLLQDTVWTTGLSLGKNLVTDSTNNYFQNPQFPVISQFTDTAHPYLRSIDTLVLFGSSSVLVTGSGIPFARFTTPSVTVTGGTTQAAIGLSEIGKGKLLLFGDATTWLNGFSAQGSLNIDAQDNLAFALNVFSVTEDYEVKLPSATPNERYQLVSIPFDLDNADIASVLKDLGGVNPLIWRLFGRYNPAVGHYAEFPSAGFNSFRRGEAYWLITRGQFNLNFGSATITPAQDFFPIRIGPGYSMIGNPFPYKVSWKESRKGDSVQTVAWTYNGSTFVPESLALEPFTGYFVKNLSKDSVTIYINPMDISASLPKSTTAQLFGEDEWRVSIAAYSGRSSDEINFAGVAKNAKRELDGNDISEPPATPTDFVIVRFNNTAWKQNAGSYAVDIRPIDDTGVFWDFDVTTAKKQSKVKLSLAALGDLPADFEVYIIDKQSEIAQRVVTSNDYEFTMGKNESRRAFRLVVGKNSFVKENTGGIPLVPQHFALRQNYPNPFNPTTVIQYTLGHSGDVSVAIYNILGQRVRTLRNEFQSIGTYSLDWDGKDESGSVVASGVYFYKITVMSNGERLFAETKKMVLMK